MKLDNCTYDLETQFVEGCDPCRRQRFNRRVPFFFGDHVLYVTFVHEVVTCPLGLAGGDLLHALSLLPKEEQEVEIIQRSKYERATHEERSVESHFEREFMSTLRNEVSASLDVNTSVTAEAGFDFLVVSGGGSATVNTAAHFSQKMFSETVSKASASVSQHYEMSVDTKSEIENSYRALRRICNPNPCRVVTYFFKQLMKKYSVKVVLVDIRFDYVRRVSELHTSVLPYHVEETRFVAAVAKPNTLASELPRQVEQLPAAPPAASNFAVGRTTVPQLRLSAINAYRSLIYRTVDMPKELDIGALAQKMEELKVAPATQKQIRDAASRLLEATDNKPGTVLFSAEYCLRTNSVIAEPKVSGCSICTKEVCGCEGEPDADATQPTVDQLERNKLALEIEVLKRQLAALA